jgi:hypothetical protein
MVDAAPGTSGEIVKAILVARDVNVLLDADLAALYGVSTTALNQLRGTLGNQKHRDPLKPPFAFTEHGAIMLAMILKSPRAIDMSVYVVRAFASLRHAAQANEQLLRQLQHLESRVGKHDAEIEAILAAMRALIVPPSRPSRSIGFLADIK